MICTSKSVAAVGPNNAPSVNDSRKPSKQCENNVEQKSLTVEAFFVSHNDWWQKRSDNGPYQPTKDLVTKADIHRMKCARDYTKDVQNEIDEEVRCQLSFIVEHSN